MPRVDVRWSATVAVVFTVMCARVGVGAEPARPYCLLDELVKSDTPCIRSYFWKDAANDALSRAFADDLMRYGMNGIQNLSTPRGGRWFPKGFQPSLVGCRVRYVYLDKDGKKQTRWHHYGDPYDPKNLDALVDVTRRRIEDHGETLFRPGGRYLMITGDESDLGYSKTVFRQISAPRDAAWREYVRRAYGDAAPGTDTNKDGRTYNAESLHQVDAWDKVPVPQVDERFDQPLLWELYWQFRSDFYYQFFRRAEKKANEQGLPVVFGFSGHGSIMYPGAVSVAGSNYYRQATVDRLFTQEAVHADWPPNQALGFAAPDRLSRKHRKPMLAWSWFWNVFRSRDTYVHSRPYIDRTFAQIFGHEVHMLLHWVYSPLLIRTVPDMQRVAFWHHWFQKHWGFIKTSHPAQPEVALLYPVHTSNFYRFYRYPKKDYTWAVQALLDLQVPFTVLTEEEVEREGVGAYKVLMVLSAERVSRATAKAIGDYIGRGGTVLADSDSMTVDVAGKRLGILEKHFGVRLTKKYKTWSACSVQSRAEEEWIDACAKGTITPPPAKTLRTFSRTALQIRCHPRRSSETSTHRSASATPAKAKISAMSASPATIQDSEVSVCRASERPVTSTITPSASPWRYGTRQSRRPKTMEPTYRKALVRIIANGAPCVPSQGIST